MPVPFTAVLRLLVVMPLLAAVGGCSAVAGYFMPSDIASMEERTARLATALQRDHPQASQTYVIDGRRMHYVGLLDAAPKPLILFVHGSPGDWTGWADYLADPELAERAQLIAVDRPGFGGSGAGETERSLHQQSRDIGVLLDKAAPGQRVILVGHSFGGPVIARLAMDYPERITDLVILAGSIDPGQEHTAWYQYPADWSLIRWTLPKDLVVCNQEIRALKPELEAMLPLWRGVTQRVTVIQGLADDLVPPENADFAERMLTHAQSLHVIRIPGMNHFIPWTQYPLVKAELLKHLG